MEDSKSFTQEQQLESFTSESSLENGGPDHQRRLNKIYRKLDWRIIPPLWGLYFLSSLGGGAYGNSLTMNSGVGHSLPQVLKLTSSHLSTASALEYVGYIVFDLPMNLIMSVVAPHTWMSRIETSIGLVYACYTAVNNSSGLIAIRFFTGMATAGIWPGMAYYISMWYPPHRAAARIGYYFTAAQLSTAVAGLIAAGFQKMDGTLGYYGWQWLFLIYGVVTAAYGILVVFILPDRPRGLRGNEPTNWFTKFFEFMTYHGSSPLSPEEEEIHYQDMKERYNKRQVWNLRDLWVVLKDVRLWPLVLMYFGVVGTGIAIMVYATTIIQAIDPGLSSIDLSLLTAPIWLFDLAAIVLITPISDLLKNYRALVFSFSTMIIIVGMCVTTWAPYQWSQYGGLLICGFGLGPTVPITMAWGAEIFQARHGDLGAAASTALISGLGNLGSVSTTYALYSGWPADKAHHYRNSNIVIVALLGFSIFSAACCTWLRFALGDFGNQRLTDVTFLKFFKRTLRQN